MKILSTSSDADRKIPPRPPIGSARRTLSAHNFRLIAQYQSRSIRRTRPKKLQTS